MTGTSCTQPAWVWPIRLEDYDRDLELKASEAEALKVHASSLGSGVLPSEVVERCRVSRLIKPIEDVCAHIELRKKYWVNTKILMLGDMAARGRSFWGWTEEEWLASIKKKPA